MKYEIEVKMGTQPFSFMDLVAGLRWSWTARSEELLKADSLFRTSYAYTRKGALRKAKRAVEKHQRMLDHPRRVSPPPPVKFSLSSDDVR